MYVVLADYRKQHEKIRVTDLSVARCLSGGGVLYVVEIKIIESFFYNVF